MDPLSVTDSGLSTTAGETLRGLKACGYVKAGTHYTATWTRLAASGVSREGLQSLLTTGVPARPYQVGVVEGGAPILRRIELGKLGVDAKEVIFVLNVDLVA